MTSQLTFEDELTLVDEPESEDKLTPVGELGREHQIRQRSMQSQKDKERERDKDKGDTDTDRLNSSQVTSSSSRTKEREKELKVDLALDLTQLTPQGIPPPAGLPKSKVLT